MQQAWPCGQNVARQGLLPDSLALRTQVRNDVAINPGTLQASAIRLFDRPPLYDYRVLRVGEIIVHAPGAIQVISDESTHSAFAVEAWPAHPCQVLITGLRSMPGVQVDQKAIDLKAPHTYDAQTGRLVLQIEGKVNVRVSY